MCLSTANEHVDVVVSASGLVQPVSGCTSEAALPLCPFLLYSLGCLCRQLQRWLLLYKSVLEAGLKHRGGH